eukprot:1138884-Pelagomonas_calceolata.AAC.7
MELASSFLENPSGFASFLANPNDGKLTYVSDTFCDQTGFSRDELLALSQSAGRWGWQARAFHGLAVKSEVPA